MVLGFLQRDSERWLTEEHNGDGDGDTVELQVRGSQLQWLGCEMVEFEEYV